MLVERAQHALLESRKLLEQREMQLKPPEQFLEQNPTIEREIVRNHRRQSQESRLELGCSAMDRKARTIWTIDAHRGDGQRFIVRSDEN